MSDVCIFSLAFLYLAAVISAPETIVHNATVGQDVTLPCQARNYRPFEVVEWSRAGKDSEYVLVFDKKHSDLEIPEQIYKGRVDLVDMEEGDVSLKLRNVTLEDGGTYECYVKKATNRRKRYIQPISKINLHVAPPPPSLGRGHIGLIVAVTVAVAVFALVIYQLSKFVWKKKKNFSPPPDEDV